MNKKIGALISGFTFLVGVTAGRVYEKSKNDKKSVPCGNLRLDKSEADEPIRLFLELNVDILALENMDKAVFKVVKQSYITQK